MRQDLPFEKKRQPLRQLRRKLTLLSTGLTGAVLVGMAFLALSLAERQLRQAAENAVQSNLNAIVAKLQTDRVVSLAWLAQTEAADRLVLSVTDQGVPLSFTGAWATDTERSILLKRAEAQSRDLGVDSQAPPISVIDSTRSPIFEVRGEEGDRYLAGVALIPAHGGYQSLVLLRDMSTADRQICLLRGSFTALVIVGVAALFGLCWFFSGRAIQPIEESQKRQAEFIAAASHELKSPLAVIRTSASAMDADPAAGPRLRAGIDRECARMGRLVDDLLTLARSDAGTWSIRREQVDLDALLLETLDGFYPLAARRGLSLGLEVPENALPLILGDGQRLRQILTVLLDNACFYTPEGGNVTLSARVEAKWVLLQVGDTGPGIAEEHLDHIFERFYRADMARNEKNHFGLGLSIARELANLHAGTLTVMKTSAAGTVFELRLPRQQGK